MTAFSLAGKRIWVAGHRGMVGSALVRRLETENCAEILTAAREDLDLINQQAVKDWMKANRPDIVIIAAAKVGGIAANDSYPANFLYDNTLIAANIIHAAYLNLVEKLLFLGSSCIYPKFAPQPISEDSLLTGSLEPTNEWYALAKITGIKLCQAYRRQYGCDFISVMPTNLYGPGDNYHLENAHVVPALLRKAHIAKEQGAASMEIWGTGTVRREFMHADDCADGLVFVLKHFSQEQHVNIGQGYDITIEALARQIMEIVGFRGELTKDISKPDGTPRKIMDNSVLAAMGWSPKHTLQSGLRDAYAWFLQHQDNLREN